MVLDEQCFEYLQNLSLISIECENTIIFTPKLFRGCDNLKSFRFIQDDSLNRPEEISFGEQYFYLNQKLEEIEITANKINIVYKNSAMLFFKARI